MEEEVDVFFFRNEKKTRGSFLAESIFLARLFSSLESLRDPPFLEGNCKESLAALSNEARTKLERRGGKRFPVRKVTPFDVFY